MGKENMSYIVNEMALGVCSRNSVKTVLSLSGAAVFIGAVGAASSALSAVMIGLPYALSSSNVAPSPEMLSALENAIQMTMKSKALLAGGLTTAGLGCLSAVLAKKFNNTSNSAPTEGSSERLKMLGASLLISFSIGTGGYAGLREYQELLNDRHCEATLNNNTLNCQK
jgi:hypothetical protein